MPSIKIDGKEYEIPRLKFKLLKQAYPIVMGVQNSDDPIAMASAAIEVVSIAMTRNPDFSHMTPEWIEDNLDLDESRVLPQLLADIMVESGLVTRSDMDGALASGEARGDAPLTETSTPSSQNSSQQDAAEETGT